MFDTATTALLRAVFEEVCKGLPQREIGARTHVTSRILEAATSGELSLTSIFFAGFGARPLYNLTHGYAVGQSRPPRMWLGLPAPVFWGVLMALLAIVPFLGAFVIWAPAAAFLALSGAYTSAIVLAIWGTLVVGLVDNVVYPILVGNKLRMHTMLSFIAVVGGLVLMGAPGVVLGPLLLAITLTLAQIWRSRAAAPIGASPQQRDAVQRP